MNTGTRAARAAASRQAKQEIVRLLFGKKTLKTGREDRTVLDYSLYSYADLKKAYLERVQEIHPDKLRESDDSAYLKKNRTIFHELQNAWDKYEEIARTMKTFQNGRIEASYFTKFGVGCSFSDNEEERRLRTEITDQACRGWFSSGALATETTKDGNDLDGETQSVSLVDDSMFETDENHEHAPTDSKNDSPQRGRTVATLIPGMRIRKT